MRLISSMRLATLVALAVASTSPPARAQASASATDGSTAAPADEAVAASFSPSLRLRARIYTRFRAGQVERTGGDETITSFNVPESRLALKLRAAEWLMGEIDFDVANQAAALRDGYVDLRYDRSLRLRVGRFKRPFSRVQLTSRRRLPTWRRGLTSRTLVESFRFGGRDRGVMLHGRLGALRYKVGWFDGGDLLSGDDHAEDGSARLTYRFGKLLEIGASGSLHYVRDPVGINGAEPRTDRWAAALDARLRAGSLELIGEATWAQGPRTRNGPQHLGALLIAQLRFELSETIGLRPVLKGEVLDHHIYRDADAAWSATAGVNLHLPMGLRFMLQGEGVWTESGAPDSTREELLAVVLVAWDYRLTLHADDGRAEGTR